MIRSNESKKLKARCFLRICAFITSVVFASTTLAWSSPDFGQGLHPQGGIHHSALSSRLPFDLPQDLGTVEEIFGWGPDRFSSVEENSQAFVLIRDAHANLSAQESIRGALAFIAGKLDQKPLILLEGAAEIVDTSLISKHPDKELKQKVAMRLFQKGQINGAELLSILDLPDIELLGIEDPMVYRNNLEAALRLFPHQDDLIAHVESIEKSFDGLMDFICSPLLSELVRGIFKRFDEKGLIDYLPWLLQKAEARAVSLESLPELSKMKSAMVQKHAEDVQNALASLDGRKLTDEVGQLEQMLLNTTEKSVKEKTFVRLYDHVRLLKRAFALKLTSAEAKYFLKYQKEFREKTFLDYLQAEGRHPRVSSCLGVDEKKSSQVSCIDALLPIVKSFYEYAFVRNDRLSKNMMKRLRERNRKWGIVVAGGFHTDALAAFLRKNSVPYVVLTPRFEVAPSTDLYKENLLRIIQFQSATLNLPRLFDQGFGSLVPREGQLYLNAFQAGLRSELHLNTVDHSVSGFGASPDDKPVEISESVQAWQRLIRDAQDYLTYSQTVAGFITELSQGNEVEGLEQYAEIVRDLVGDSEGSEVKYEAKFSYKDVNWWKYMRIRAFVSAAEVFEETFSLQAINNLESELIRFFERLQADARLVQREKPDTIEKIKGNLISIETSLDDAVAGVEGLEGRFKGSLEANLYRGLIENSTDLARTLLEKVKLRWFRYYETLADRELKRYSVARKLLFMSPVIPQALADLALGEADAQLDLAPYMKMAQISEQELFGLLKAEGIEELTNQNKEEFLRKILKSVDTHLVTAGKYLNEAGAIVARHADTSALERRPHQGFRQILAERFLALSNAWGWESQGEASAQERATAAKAEARRNFDLSSGEGAIFGSVVPINLFDMLIADLEITRANEALQEAIHLPSMQKRARMKTRRDAKTWRSYMIGPVLVRFMLVHLNRRYSSWNELMQQVLSQKLDRSVPSESDLTLFDEALLLLSGKTSREDAMLQIHEPESSAPKGQTEQLMLDLLGERGRRVKDIIDGAMKTVKDPIDAAYDETSDLDRDIRRISKYLEKLEEMREQFKKTGWSLPDVFDQILPRAPLLQSPGATPRDQGIMTLAAIYWSGILYWGGPDSAKGSTTQKVQIALGYIINEGLLYRDETREDMISMYELRSTLEKHGDMRRLNLNDAEWKFLIELFERTFTPKVSPLYEKVRDIAEKSAQMSVGDLIESLRTLFNLERRNYLKYVFGSVVEEIKAAARGDIDQEILLKDLNQRIERILGMLHVITGVERPAEEKGAPPMARRIPEIEAQLKIFGNLNLKAIERQTKRAFFLRFVSWVMNLLFTIPFMRAIVSWLSKRAQQRVEISSAALTRQAESSAPQLPDMPLERKVRPFLEKIHLYGFLHGSGLLDVSRLFIAAAVLVFANIAPKKWLTNHREILERWAIWGDMPVTVLWKQQLNQLKEIRNLRRELLRPLEDIYTGAFEFYRLESRRKLRKASATNLPDDLLDSAAQDLNVARRRLDTAVAISREGAEIDAQLHPKEIAPPHKNWHAHPQLFVDLGRAHLYHIQSTMLYSTKSDETLNQFYKNAIENVRDLWKEPYRVRAEEGVAEELEFELIDDWLVPFGLRNMAVERLLEISFLGFEGVESEETLRKGLTRFVVLEKLGTEGAALGQELDQIVEEILRTRHILEGEPLRQLLENREKKIQAILNQAEQNKDIQRFVSEAMAWGRSLAQQRQKTLEGDFKKLELEINRVLKRSHGKKDVSVILEYARILSREAVYGPEALTEAERDRKQTLAAQHGLTIRDNRIEEYYKKIREPIPVETLQPPKSLNGVMALAISYASGILFRRGSMLTHKEIAFIFQRGLIWEDPNTHRVPIEAHRLKHLADANEKLKWFLGDEKPFFDALMRAVRLYPSSGFGANSEEIKAYPINDPGRLLKELGITEKVESAGMVVYSTDQKPTKLIIDYHVLRGPFEESLARATSPILAGGMSRAKRIEILLPLPQTDVRFKPLQNYIAKLNRVFGKGDQGLSRLHEQFQGIQAGFGAQRDNLRETLKLWQRQELHRRLLAAYESVHHPSVDSVIYGSPTLAGLFLRVQSMLDTLQSKMEAKGDQRAAKRAGYALNANGRKIAKGIIVKLTKVRERFARETKLYETLRAEVWAPFHQETPKQELLDHWEAKFLGFASYIESLAGVIDELNIDQLQNKKFDEWTSDLKANLDILRLRLKTLEHRLKGEPEKETTGVIKALQGIQSGGRFGDRFKIANATTEYFVEASAYTLEIMLKNPIANALRDQSALVVVDARVESGHVIVSIQDNGRGIPYEIFRRMFDPGVSKTQAGQSKGTGSGLFLLRFLSTRMDGEISVTTRTEKKGWTGQMTIHGWEEAVVKEWTQIATSDIDLFDKTGFETGTVFQIRLPLAQQDSERANGTGFGAQSLERRVYAFLNSSAFDGQDSRTSAALLKLDQWKEDVRKAGIQSVSRPRFILTGFDSLPETKSVIEDFTASGGKWTVAFAGTLDEGIDAFRKKYNVKSLWDGVALLPYSNANELSTLSFNAIRQHYEQYHIPYENMVALFGGALKNELKKMPSFINRLYDSPQSAQDLKWDTILALITWGPHHPAVAPFLVKESGLLRLITLEELADRLVASKEFAKAA